jgi:hypothetical protein
LAHLRHEIASVSDAVRHLGGEARYTVARGASELGDYVAEHGPVLARQVGRQAIRAGTAVRNDPLPTVVALASLFLLVRLFSGSSK